MDQVCLYDLSTKEYTNYQKETMVGFHDLGIKWKEKQ